MAILDKQKLNLIGDPKELHFQRVQLALHAKQLKFTEHHVENSSIPETLSKDIDKVCNGMNLAFLPAIVDRSTALEGADIIFDYLDGRFPEPNLYPSQPTARGRTNFSMHRLTKMYYYCLEVAASAVNEMSKPETERDIKVIETGSLARMHLLEGLKSFDTVLSESDYFLSDSLTFIDCTTIPLFVNLKRAAINLNDPALKNIAAFISRESDKHYFQATYSTRKETMKKQHF